MEILLILFGVCIVERCFIFFQRDVSFWKALIPGYNKYVLGKLCNCKKLGIATAIFLLLLIGALIGIYNFEVWIVETYASNGVFVNPATGQLILDVPEHIANWLQVFKYVIIGLAACSITAWSWLMLKFSQMHQKSNWWILLWALCPAIPYTMLAFSKQVAMYGKRYTVKKVESVDKRRKLKRNHR